MQQSEGTELGDPPKSRLLRAPSPTRQVQAESLHPPGLPPQEPQTPPPRDAGNMTTPLVERHLAWGAGVWEISWKFRNG